MGLQMVQIQLQWTGKEKKSVFSWEVHYFGYILLLLFKHKLSSHLAEQGVMLCLLMDLHNHLMHTFN